MTDRPRGGLAALCIAQTTSWGLLYYSLPVALAPIAADTGWSHTAITAALTFGLIVSAIAGLRVGKLLNVNGLAGSTTVGSLIRGGCVTHGGLVAKSHVVLHCMVDSGAGPISGAVPTGVCGHHPLVWATAHPPADHVDPGCWFGLHDFRADRRVPDRPVRLASQLCDHGGDSRGNHGATARILSQRSLD